MPIAEYINPSTCPWFTKMKNSNAASTLCQVDLGKPNIMGGTVPSKCCGGGPDFQILLLSAKDVSSFAKSMTCWFCLEVGGWNMLLRDTDQVKCFKSPARPYIWQSSLKDHRLWIIPPFSCLIFPKLHLILYNKSKGGGTKSWKQNLPGNSVRPFEDGEILKWLTGLGSNHHLESAHTSSTKVYWRYWNFTG